jgi:hypothetical protein
VPGSTVARPTGGHCGPHCRLPISESGPPPTAFISTLRDLPDFTGDYRRLLTYCWFSLRAFVCHWRVCWYHRCRGWDRKEPRVDRTRPPAAEPRAGRQRLNRRPRLGRFRHVSVAGLRRKYGCSCKCFARRSLHDRRRDKNAGNSRNDRGRISSRTRYRCK